MPTISRFFGIAIRMYWSEHGPPHFHARYAGRKASIDIRNLAVIQGDLPPRALGLTLEWAAIHQKELLENWRLCVQRLSPQKLPGLE